MKGLLLSGSKLVAIPPDFVAQRVMLNISMFRCASRMNPRLPSSFWLRTGFILLQKAQGHREVKDEERLHC